MNKLWRRTASHKNSNEAGKHSRRLQFSNGRIMILLVALFFFIIGVTK